MQVNGLASISWVAGAQQKSAPAALASTSVSSTLNNSPINNPADSINFASDLSSTSRVSSTSSASDLEQQNLEQSLVQALAQRDREVRQHEMAHKVVGGPYTGAISYTYERGPDGQLYAVGGEVSIDTSPVPGDPEASLQKAETIARAALAPADPSPQDLKVAAQARSMAAEARAEIALERAEAQQIEADEALLQEPAEQAEVRPELGLVTSEEQAESRLEADNTEAQKAEEQALDEREAAAERRREVADEMQAQRERSAQRLREFNERLVEIQQALQALNSRLIATGALPGPANLGSLLDRQA